MGKSGDPQQLGFAVDDLEAGGVLATCPPPCAARISKAFSLRCIAMLLFSAAVVLSALFSLPFFRTTRRSGFLSDDPDVLSADIQASFILAKPFPVLVSNIGRLEYDILAEIGVPNTKVSIISMHPLASTNSTYVVFAVLPDPKNASISLPALSVLRSSLVELVLQQLNLSLTPSVFGQSSAFEVLKFPGGITVIPAQSASIWEMMQTLFNFTVDSSIVQIQNDLEELKDQLKTGLSLRSYENVYVQITNVNGSTVAPPVIVNASVLSDFGSRSLLPNRLKQLAQVITGSHAENLGLNHSVFGKVKGIVLSSYLQHSIDSPSPSPSPCASPSPSPSPSPWPSSSPSPSPSSSPSLSGEVPAVSPSHPTFPYAPVPSVQHPQPPCLRCDKFVPSQSPSSYASAPENDSKPPSQSYFSPGPSIQDHASPPKHGPCSSSSVPPSGFNTLSPSFSPIPAIPPQHKPIAPASQMAPGIYGPSPLQKEGSSSQVFSMSASPSISHVATYYVDRRLIGLLAGSLIYFLLCCGGMF